MSNADKRYEPITGNPNRSTREEDAEETASEKLEEEQEPGSPKEQETDSSADLTSASGGQKKRVSVTPRDWEKLKALAEEFGLPYSKIYNMSFSALLEKLGRKNGTDE